jgi:hypothetical protein
MESKHNQAWQDYDNLSKRIEAKKDRLLYEIESKLQQKINKSPLFSARWTVR